MPLEERTTIAVAVCTLHRNGPLEVLLEGLLANAERLGGRVAVGVVVVDDSSDCGARELVGGFDGRFELGIHYRVSARQNISLARNLAIDTAADVADWVAMTDDDCEPTADWLDALIEAQQRTGADAISGPYRRRLPPGSARWLIEEPFLEIALDSVADGAVVQTAGTNNSMISSAWWKAHPDVRFLPALGVTGGEDVVFYRTACAAGLRIRHTHRAVVYENEPPSRTSLAYQLWLFFWLGNSSYVTRLESGQARPFRMFLQGGNAVRAALARSLRRLLRRQTPQLRYCLASVLHGIGMMIGPFGIRVSHH